MKEIYRFFIVICLFHSLAMFTDSDIFMDGIIYCTRPVEMFLSTYMIYKHAIYLRNILVIHEIIVTFIVFNHESMSLIHLNNTNHHIHLI